MKRICFITALIYLLGLLPVAVFGQLGSNALRFDGTDDYVSIPDNAAFNVSAVTIEMWFKWENYTTPDEVDFLIGKGLEQLEIHTGGGAGENALRFIPTTGVYLDTPENSFAPGNWYHVAYMYNPADATKYACYINGTAVALTALGTVTTSITTTTEPLKIGIRQGLATPFQGYIDEVRIWNTARTEAEIQAARNTELAGNETGLVAYYKMNEGSGTSADDASPNSNTGTLMSGTAWSGMLYVSNLTPGLTGMSGATFKWYSADYPGGTLYTGNESLVNGQKYYAAQVVNGVESTARKEVTANLTSVSIPTAGTHTATATSITWNWNAVSGATGYKWNTTNNYGSATNLGNVLTLTQNSLSFNTNYTIYIWAYDATGCNSNSVSLSTTIGLCVFTGSLEGLRHLEGQTLEFLVTGSTSGSSWGGCGTDYMDKTDLQTAAVHSGYVANGVTKYVSVLKTAAQTNYVGCTQNGVVSATWAAAWGGSYRIVSSRNP